MQSKVQPRALTSGVLTVLMCSVAMFASGTCRGDIADVVATRDNTLYEHAMGAFSNGAGFFTFSGVNSSEAERRALVFFDLSQAVPAGSMVTSASLTLNCSRSVATGGAFALHRVASSWGEGTSNAGDPGGQGAASQPGDATWQHRFFPGTPWSVPGGDYVGTPSATRNVGTTGPYAWSSPEMAADVQAWVDDPTTNHGWIVISATGTARNARRFDTRENPDPNVRPMLHIVFTPPPRCVGDVDDGTGAGHPDGGITIDDLLYYLFVFEAGDSRADVDDGTRTGTPDGGVTIEDLTYFLERYAMGC